MRIDQVITRLRSEAHSLLGEMMLGSLIEAAKDVMTEMNQPEGHCIFCLEELVAPQTKPSQETLLRLPCYHCYHLCDPIPHSDAISHFMHNSAHCSEDAIPVLSHHKHQ